MTIRKPSALVVARVCPTGYSECIGGKRLHCHSPAMTSDLLAAKIGQRNAADMTIRFKALKMGATVEMINTMNVFDLLDWISENV